MSPFIALKHSLHNFTKKEVAIANYILEDPTRIVNESPAEIVKNADSSKSAFIRMCQKINFEGYVDFRYACIAYIEQHKNDEIDKETDYASKITNQYIEKIEKIVSQLDRDTFEIVSQLILKSDRIRSYGFNASLLVCQQLHLRALQLGLEIISSSNDIIFSNTLTILKNNDLVLFFAVNANSSCHKKNMENMKHVNCKKVLITMVDLPVETKIFDYSIVLPSVPISTNNLYLDNQTIFFVFIDILMQSLSENQILQK